MKQDIANILDYLTRVTSIDFSGYNYELLTKLLDNRIHDTGTENYQNYLEHLGKNIEEPDKLISGLTVQVSEFFRNPVIHNYLSEILMPNLVQQKKIAGDTTIRVWSAGCAQGEEAYSLAMVVREFIEKNQVEILPRIFATDIEKTILNKAQEAIFSFDSIKNVPYGFVQKYFKKNEKYFHVTTNIKKMVSFSLYDLLAPKTVVPPESVFGNFDIVFCRNVLMYYTPPAQNLIMRKLYSSLASKGFLILGESEFVPERYKNNFRPIIDLRIFQKRG